MVKTKFLLFPVMLLVICFSLSPRVTPCFVNFIVVVTGVLLFCGYFDGFFGGFCNTFRLVLCFYTLRVLPSFIL